MSFAEVFENSPPPVRETAEILRKIVRTEIKGADESVAGGAKVKLVLYATNDPQAMVCGIQPSGDNCLFYLHRIQPADVTEYKLEGKGKHAKHIKLASPDEINKKVIKRLLKTSLERRED